MSILQRMRDLPLAHLIQPVVQLLLGCLLPAVVIRWWGSLFQAHVIMRVHVPDLTGAHPGMSTDSLEDTSLAHKGLGHPEIALELDIVLVHGHLLGFQDRILNMLSTFLQCKTQLLHSLIDGHSAHQRGHVPQLLRTVLDVGLGMADVLEWTRILIKS